MGVIIFSDGSGIREGIIKSLTYDQKNSCFGALAQIELRRFRRTLISFAKAKA